VPEAQIAENDVGELEFAVCVPAYNAERMLPATLESILAQTVSAFELVVVDDGSLDRTAEIAKSYAARDPRVRLIQQKNRGSSAARNTAVANSTAPLLSFIDSDDLWMPGYLEAARRAFAADPATGFVHADARSFRDSDLYVFHKTQLEEYAKVVVEGRPDRVLPKLLRVNFITSSSVSARREAVREAGGWHPIARAQDWDMWLRILSAGYSLARAGETPLVLLRDHPTSQSKDPVRMAKGVLTVTRHAAERAGSRPERVATHAAVRRAEAGLRRVEHPSPAARIIGSGRRLLRRIKRDSWGERGWQPPSEAALAVLSGAGAVGTRPDRHDT